MTLINNSPIKLFSQQEYKNMLYKYISNKNNLLSQGYIRASQIKALNDPYEGRYCVNSLIDLANEMDDLDCKGLELVNEIDKGLNKIGIISLTETKDNLLMWSHYANEHKGLVIGFNELKFESEFVNKETDLLTSKFNGIASHVKYSSRLKYNIDAFDADYGNISMEQHDRMIHDILLMKGDSWIYEKEHRILLRLYQSDRVIINNQEDIEEIKNMRWYKDQDKLMGNIGLTSHFTNKRAKIDRMIIDLNNIKDISMRFPIGKSIEHMSKHPCNIYLFKLCPSSYSHVIYGHSSNADNLITNEEKKFLTHVGHIDEYLATIDFQNFGLQFHKLGRWKT